MKAIAQLEIDRQVYALYDEYCHGGIERREFLKRAAALGAAGLAMAQALMPDYARAQTISFTDSRIKVQYVTYPSPGGNAERIRGYLVQPAGEGPWPAVLVVHENRGLNPYIEDVAPACHTGARTEDRAGVSGYHTPVGDHRPRRSVHRAVRS